MGYKEKTSRVRSLLDTLRVGWSGLARQAGIARLAYAARHSPSPAPASAVNKPANLLYGVEEQPPAQVIWFSAIQQVAISSIYMIYPLIVAREAGLQADQIINMLQLGCVVLGVAILLQALPRGPVGSPSLAPSSFTGLYFASSLLAVKTGGMPLLWGMTIIAGVVEMALSLVWRRLRAFVPPESAGLVVFFIGSIIGLAACRMLLSEGPAGATTPADGS